MAAITASMVAELRGKTDAPMMECKKALTNLWKWKNPLPDAPAARPGARKSGAPGEPPFFILL